MSTITRIFLTVVVLCAFSFAGFALSTTATIETGQIAGQQLLPSNSAYIATQSTFMFFRWVTVVFSLGTFLAVVLIWLDPLKKFWAGFKHGFTDGMQAILVAIALTSLIPIPQAKAYWAGTDATEGYTIGPNETAIVVPDVGDNKNTQVQMDSEDYLKSKQVPHKFVTIPHAKLQGSGGTSLLSGWDNYKPTARLFIVDRTTYSHEWVGKGRGTNPNMDESIPCQSKEGLNITVGISIGSTVKEDDAAKFLYNFGVQIDTKENRADPQVIFKSVYYSRKVADVMGDIGRKAVQGIVCNEITARSFDDDNKEANSIMENVRKKATDYLASVGITLTFIGWADTFSFDPEVQKAVNDKYVACTLAPLLPVMTAITNLKVQEGLGDGLKTHGLPIVITPEMLQTLSGMATKLNGTPGVTPSPTTSSVTSAPTIVECSKSSQLEPKPAPKN